MCVRGLRAWPLAELLGWFWANVLTETAAPLSVKRKINVPAMCVYPDIEILFKGISYLVPFEIHIAYPIVKNTYNGFLI